MSRLVIDVTGPGPDGSVCIALAGELDSDETERLRSAVTDALHRHAPAPIRIDAGLTFLDSGGIRALLTCRRLAENAGSRLSIHSLSPIVYQVLQITGLLNIFGVAEPAPDGVELPDAPAAGTAAQDAAPRR